MGIFNKLLQNFLTLETSLSSYIRSVIFKSSLLIPIKYKHSTNTFTRAGSLFIKFSSFLFPSPQYKAANTTKGFCLLNGNSNSFAIVSAFSHPTLERFFELKRFKLKASLNSSFTCTSFMYLKMVPLPAETMFFISDKVCPLERKFLINSIFASDNFSICKLYTVQ
ncbi:MAG: hypothetical protein AAB350_01570 [Patescibacteria group bacterium]